MDLNYSEPTANLLTRYQRRETDWFHSRCGQNAGHESSREISLLPSQWFSLPGVDLASDLHLQQVPKQSGKERNTLQSVSYEPDSLWICRFSAINLIQVAVSERSSKLTEIAQIISGGAKFKAQIYRLQNLILPLH